MDDQTYLPTQNEPPERPITPVLSSGLKSLLVDGENAYGAMREIVADGALNAECLAQLPVLRAAVRQKAGEHGVREVIGKRFALYPQPARSEGEWAAWWADYYEALADVAWHALEAGMAAWVKDPASEFLPKPGKLLELSRMTPSRIAIAHHRAQMVADYEPPKVYDNPTPVEPPPLRTMSQADTNEAIRKMHAEFLKANQAREVAAKPNVELPSIAGKPDEGGLTPRMREWIARQKGE